MYGLGLSKNLTKESIKINGKNHVLFKTGKNEFSMLELIGFRILSRKGRLKKPHSLIFGRKVCLMPMEIRF